MVVLVKAISIPPRMCTVSDARVDRRSTQKKRTGPSSSFFLTPRRCDLVRRWGGSEDRVDTARRNRDVGVFRGHEETKISKSSFALDRSLVSLPGIDHAPQFRKLSVRRIGPQREAFVLRDLIHVVEVHPHFRGA